VLSSLPIPFPSPPPSSNTPKSVCGRDDSNLSEEQGKQRAKSEETRRMKNEKR
jgi:hypothetical protein